MYLPIFDEVRKKAAVQTILQLDFTAEQNTTANNDLGPDGKTWAQSLQPVVDPYGYIWELISREDAGSGIERRLYWCAYDGSTWQDLATPGDFLYPVPMTRASACYDSVNDKIHAIYSGSGGNGIIYRRYSITRSPAPSLTIDIGVSVQLDYETDGTMTYEHPVILFCPDIGSNGAVVACWHAQNNGGTKGTEVRVSMRELTNNANDGNAANWEHLGVSSTTAIANAPQVGGYTAIYSTNIQNATIGWPSMGRHPTSNDLCFAYVSAAGYTWLWRRAVWNAGTSRWSSLSATASIGQITEAGTDSGYTLKNQLGTKFEFDSNGDAYFGLSVWKNNTVGDAWKVVKISTSDVVSTFSYTYSSVAALNGNDIFITGDILYDSVENAVIVSYTDLAEKIAKIAVYDTSGSETQDRFTIYYQTPVDIPILFTYDLRPAFMFRDFNAAAIAVPPGTPTFTPPYVGYWGRLKWDVAPTYINLVLGTRNDDLLAYWPMNETSGTTADNAEGTAARDGTYQLGPVVGQSYPPFVSPSFDGDNDRLNVYTANLGGVFDPDELTITWWQRTTTAWWNDATQRRPYLCQTNSNNRIFAVSAAGADDYTFSYVGGGTTKSITKTSVTALGTNWVPMAMRVSKLVDTFEVFIFGQSIGTQSSLPTWTGALALFLIANGSPNAFGGTIAHFAVWDRYLDSYEILALSRMYREKNVVFDGDSLTVGGQLGAKPYPKALGNTVNDTTAENWKTTNVAVAGQKVSAMNADAATEVDPLRDTRNYRKNIVVCFGGANDIQNETAATAYGRLQTYWAARRAAGWRVVAVTLPAGDPASVNPYNTFRNVLNTLIMSDTTLYDAVARLDLDPNIGPDGSENNGTYYNADKLHFTTAGYGIIAGIVLTAVQSV